MRKSNSSRNSKKKTSTPLASRMKSFQKNRQPQQKVNTSGTSHTKQYKLSEKQMKNWKPLDKDIKDYLYMVIDSTVKTVCSKPVYNKEEEVQDLLSQLKKKLKMSLDKVKVPKKKLGKFKELKQRATDLKEEYENLTNQQLELEKEIRQEERLIEALEDGYKIEDLVVEVPDDVLRLPKMVFSPS